jgi:hypothetical protein
MAFPFSTVIDILNSTLCLYLAFRLYRASQRDPSSNTLRNFCYTYVALTLAYVLLFLPRLFAPQGALLLSAAFALGNFTFLVAGSFFGRIVLRFTRPASVRVFSVCYYALAAVCLGWSLVDRALPVVDASTGITQWNAPLGVGLLGGTLLLLVLIPGAVLFLSRGIRTRDNHIVRVRSITIGIGAILLILTAISFNLAKSEALAIIGDLFSISALLTIFLGVIYHRSSPVQPVQPHQSPA